MSKNIVNRLGIQVDINARKGADFRHRFQAQVLSGDTYYNYDLSQYTGATLEVRRKSNTPVVELTFSTSDNTIVLGNDGYFDLIMGYENMNKIRAGEYVYDMYLSNATYQKRDFMFGKFIIEDKITR